MKTKIITFLIVFVLLMPSITVTLAEDIGELGSEGVALNVVTDDGEVQNLSASGASSVLPNDVAVLPRWGSIILSWKNPMSDKITNISVTSNGVEITKKGGFKTGSGAINYLIIDMSSGSEYSYDIWATVNGVTKSVNVSGTFSSIDQGNMKFISGYQLGNWNVGQLSSASTTKPDDYPFGSLEIDNTVKASGNSSFKVLSNMDGVRANVALALNYSITLDPAKKYRLRFKAKVENGSGCAFVLVSPWTWYNLWSNKATFDWKEFKYDLPTGSEENLKFNFENSNSGFWLDDVSLYELKDGNETGNNLIKNGGFEYEVVNPQISGRTLSWTIPQGVEWTAINVYKKTVSGNLVLLNEESLKGDATSFQLPDAVSESDNFVIKTTYGEGNYVSKGISYSSLAIYEQALYNSNEATITSLENGQLTVKTKIKNNNKGDNFTAELIAALYNGDKMVAFNTTGLKTIAQTPSSNSPEELLTKIDVPDLAGGDYHLETFVWSSLADKNVLIPYKVFNEPN